MKGSSGTLVDSNLSSTPPDETTDRNSTSDHSEPGTSNCKVPRTSFLSSIVASAFSVLETYREPSTGEKKENHIRNNGWSSTVKELVGGGSMRRIHEYVLGPCRSGIPSTACDIWILGVCYKISQVSSSGDVSTSNELAAFMLDLSSRILITYRKGFDVIGDSKLTSDVGWGCMLRSSQMLIAQALLLHCLGRSWRISFDKPLDEEYVDILNLFGDSEASAFSIHNLLQAGKPYGLSAGSWVGPYAVCRSWESLVRTKREEMKAEFQSFPIAIYVVSGDGDGERGGAPILCIEDASRLCSEFSEGEENWMPIVLLVPLVLGLDKINTRYIPLLQATFTFPQSLGILGGKPGASTYIIGVQDNNALYLDPHDVQPVVSISSKDLEANTSSYHSNVIQHVPLDSIDPSLALGFYCRDKDDFDNFCVLASKLAEESNGAPLFTVTSSHKLSKPAFNDKTLSNSNVVQADESLALGLMPTDGPGGSTQEDDWQLL